jgi:hypothetical protein
VEVEKLELKRKAITISTDTVIAFSERAAS